MPWEVILAALGTSSFFVIILVVLAMAFGKPLAEGGATLLTRRFSDQMERAMDEHRSALAQAAEAHKATLAMGSVIDTDLRNKRVDAYATLWQLTQVLPKWPRAEGVTYERLRQFSAELREWYFHTGGMWLSHAARDAYGDVQEAIWELPAGNPSDVLDPKHYDATRDKCSALRTALTDDLLSRREAPL
jgi:hypothetical protein